MEAGRGDRGSCLDDLANRSPIRLLSIALLPKENANEPSQEVRFGTEMIYEE